MKTKTHIFAIPFRKARFFSTVFGQKVKKDENCQKSRKTRFFAGTAEERFFAYAVFRLLRQFFARGKTYQRENKKQKDKLLFYFHK